MTTNEPISIVFFNECNQCLHFFSYNTVSQDDLKEYMYCDGDIYKVGDKFFQGDILIKIHYYRIQEGGSIYHALGTYFNDWE